MEIGDKIKFDGEKQRYTLQAFNDRFFILTKPYNLQKTYLYTIVDIERKVRGRCNLILGLPADCNTPEGADKCMKWLEGFNGGVCKMDVSRREYKNLTKRELEIFTHATD